MSIWLAIPSKRPPEEAEPVLQMWRERGYKIALWRDEYDPPITCDLELDETRHCPYPGYASAVNELCRLIIQTDHQARWIVAAGDDTLPDPNHMAEEIARECQMHFSKLHAGVDALPGANLSVKSVREALKGLEMQTFGVMQPTGDRWGEGQGGFANALIDRVAGSPWIGREFARRMYGGAGPYWHEYRHMYVDEEIQAVATKLGVFWQRPALIHLHNHWGRPREGERMAPSERMPAFLAEANSPQHWRKYKALFESRREAGFPGHEPIA